MRWIAGPLIIAVGILLMKYTVQLTNITGRLSLAEKYLHGFGGTYAWWRILGLAGTIFGLMWLTGIVEYDSNTELGLPRDSDSSYIQSIPHI